MDNNVVNVDNEHYYTQYRWCYNLFSESAINNSLKEEKQVLCGTWLPLSLWCGGGYVTLIEGAFRFHPGYQAINGS